ncbi:TonB-dependent receptor plug domain-containing protein [Erythrobacter sp. BLCC-B19]|uniref:TonB-dependent receptor plug domain-containing protein n=1 Tax=Erythrobacter sp. BLCC-B19 TaxID=3025315 RepID=UPI00235F27EB|nr:TonB-dependent receptor [Erythrobacter sp. BLCC-B19]WDA39969.1 TonB-dependent receptor [Erythrobacter sp. BLCC-B19]
MKNFALLGSVAAAALVWAAPVVAQDESEREETITFADYRLPAEILVSASRDGSLVRDSFTGSALVITADELEARQTRDIADVLRDVPGVAVAGVAGQTQIRLRGSEANHVLVLVDGIEVSDPFAGEFDVGTLQAEPGARVEVLRGQQSALYGPDAIGGVVAYESASGRGRPGFAARLEGGLDNTINGALRYGAYGDSWDAALSAVVVSTDGQPNARNGTRDIGRDSYTLAGKGSVAVSDTLTLRAAARFIRTEGQSNDSNFDTTSPTFGFIIDSPGTGFTNEAVYALVGARLETLEGRWTHDLSAQIADVSRETFGPFGTSSSSEGDRVKASYVSALRIAGEHNLTFAADYEVEGFRNTTPGGFAFNGRREIEQVGLVGEYRYAGEAFDFSAALRHDINDLFQDATTFRVGAGYRITETTRLRAAAGSGVKNPGFFELYGFVDGRFIGNAALRPEKSTGWEVGLDQQLGDYASVAVTYFDSELEGEIFTTFPPPTFIATPANRATESQQRGVEVSLNARLADQWSLDAAYSYLDAEENGVEEVRRPQHIASAALTWTAPGDKASATLVVRHNGATPDVAFTDPSFVPVRVQLDDYTLVNLNARVKLTDSLSAFARVENLLDETYEQVFSFVSPGRSAVVGVEARF